MTNKYKIGDKFTYIKGGLRTINEINKNRYDCYRILYNDGRDGSWKSEKYIDEEYMLIPEEPKEFKVGDRVVLVSTDDEIKDYRKRLGDVGTLINIDGVTAIVLWDIDRSPSFFLPYIKNLRHYEDKNEIKAAKLRLTEINDTLDRIERDRNRLDEEEKSLLEELKLFN